MFRVTAIIEDRIVQAIDPKVEEANFRNFGHAAASIRKAAIQSIERAPVEQRRGPKRRGGARVSRARQIPSKPGTPPHTGPRRILKKAILFDADEEGAIIGPAYSLVGESMEAHEFGGEYRGQEYPERPFMGPALDDKLDRLIGNWSGSVGE